MSNKCILEVTENNKKRVKAISASAGTTIKDVSSAILDWALPHFEEGGEYEIATTKVTKKHP